MSAQVEARARSVALRRRHSAVIRALFAATVFVLLATVSRCAGVLPL